MDLILCPNCGAGVLVTDATTAAATRYFCHNQSSFSRPSFWKFLPNKVYLLQSKKEAAAKFLEWAQKKWFVPRETSYDQAQVEN